jgi:hypothetical protein
LRVDLAEQEEVKKKEKEEPTSSPSKMTLFIPL